MLRQAFREGVSHVGRALREPEEFAALWNAGQANYRWYIWLALMGAAIVGTLTYGMTMGVLGGPDRVLLSGLYCTLAAGLAWGISLPTLYFINSLTGSKLRPSTTLLAALVTTSWGGLAMIASIPFNWFFLTAIPNPKVALVINLLVFTGVGVAMIDVFGRVMRRLEPERGRMPALWLALVTLIGSELFYFFGLFDFSSGI